MSDEVLMFPIKNEHGFRVDSPDNYQHMIQTIVDHQVTLALEFPNNPVFVVFEV